jgi:phosphohistidine phosphatase
MKCLTVLRHAKSSWDDPRLDDFDRPLNDRGWKAVRRMGRALKHRDMRFDFVLASPAARVRETLDGLKENVDVDLEIRFEPRMDGAGEEMLLQILREIPESVHAALIVGHNPGLQRLVVELTHDDPKQLRDRVARKLPTAALAQIELPARRWVEVEPGSGEIVELIVPKELD